MHCNFADQQDITCVDKDVPLCRSTDHITQNSLIERQDLINHHKLSDTPCAAVGGCDLLFCHLSGLLAAHPYCGCQQMACRCHLSVCRRNHSVDWPLTEESPEDGAPPAEHHSGPPSSSAVPWNGGWWRIRRERRWIRYCPHVHGYFAKQIFFPISLKKKEILSTWPAFKKNISLHMRMQKWF